MAETNLEKENQYTKAVDIIDQEMIPLYKEWWPIEYIVKSNQALEFKTITQAGMTYYESKGETHFIVPTQKLYDLITPHEYEHKVVVYQYSKYSDFGTRFHGREVDCHAYIIKWQSETYKFSYKKYVTLKGKLLNIEKSLEELSRHMDNLESDNIQAYVDIITRGIRKELDLELDDDSPALSLEEAIKQF